MIALFIIWIILSILCASYAKNSKGRSFGAYLAVSLIFSPLIGFIMALVVTDLREGNALENGTLTKCPFCLELIKADAKICKHCHKEQGKMYYPGIEQQPK